MKRFVARTLHQRKWFYPTASLRVVRALPSSVLRCSVAHASSNSKASSDSQASNSSSPTKVRYCYGCGASTTSKNAEVGLLTTKRYTDLSEATGYLCKRCKTLNTGNVWKAYDALQDVDPKVFKDKLKTLVARRKFGLCIKVVDAADFEGSIVPSLRDAIGGIPIILAINKIDLLPYSDEYQLNYMMRRLNKRRVNCIEAHAVSALTQQGVSYLAEAVLSKLGGRDIFVVGAANVGKSSLVKVLSTEIVNNLRLKGRNKAATNRRNSLNTMEVTTSHLPGTTLQSVRIPCFPSKYHAMWDTPGIINRMSLTTHIFPPHIMEPLARPDPIRLRDPLYLKEGDSLVFEASWMQKADDDQQETTPPVDKPVGPALARIDVVACAAKSSSTLHDNYPGVIITRVYAPPGIGLRVVRTTNAPTSLKISQEYIEKIQRRVGKSVSLLDRTKKELDLTFFQNVEPAMNNRLWHSTEICLPSLGWVTFASRCEMTIAPYVVSGSRWFKREPPMYPNNIVELVRKKAHEESLQETESEKEKRRRLRDAGEQGRHLANTAQKKKNEGEWDEYDDWEMEEGFDDWIRNM